MPAVEGILLIDIPSNTRIVPGQNFQSHGPKMRPSNHDGFTLLPLEPPPPTPPRAIPNGRLYDATPRPVSTNPPEYHSVPEAPRRQAPQYQEIPYATSNGHASPAEEAQPPSLSTSQQSDTEVDQALYRTNIPTSNSTVPLTDSADPPPIPGERRPRKKANPLYDGFGEVVTTTSSSIRKPPPSKDSCHGLPCRSCIKHPITLFVIFLFVIVNFVALLLLFTGTVEQAFPGMKQELVQPTPDAPSYAELVGIIESLTNRVSQLEELLMTNSSENATTSTRVAQNSRQIELLANQITTSSRNISTQLQAVKRDVEQNEVLIAGNIQKTSQLEAEISSLTAQSQTVSQDILSINEKNGEQDADITMLESKVTTIKQEIALDLANYNDSIYMELESISKMQGPPGVNGSRGTDGEDGADLSRCEYAYSQTSSSFNRDVTTGQMQGPKEGFVFTGVSCATYGGTAANLMVNADNDLFFCQCEGQTTAYQASSRFCTIHYWQCPIA